ncbi:adenylate/guanylate cyclase domain-containing protein [Nocardioides sp. CPCC 206347]|uniref:adenylate/guanylate cyclase domain-containing protein n=1 Tax=unclassified Nocardioides TaxID=2615069 RepID=UPI003617CA9A
MGVKPIRAWMHERHAQMPMARWMLEFDEREVERDFVAYDDGAGADQAVFALWIGVFFTAFYSLIDVLVIPDDVGPAFALRYGVVIPVFVVAAALRRASFVERHFQLFSVLLLSVTLISLGTAFAAMTDATSEYIRASCTVTLLGGIGLLRLRMHAAVAASALYAAICLGLPGFSGGTEGVANHVAPAIGLTSIALLIAYALEKLRRTDYLRQRDVEMEQARSDELLHNVLPAAIATRLRTERGAIAESAANVSVLFSDIVGFTTVSESLTAEELVSLLDTMFSEFDRLCDQRGIEKIKTVGDAYMAVAGLPTPDRDHAASLAELAMDMQRASTRLAAGWPSPIAMRIGISSGPVVAGVIGQRKFTYDLWGDTVNTASRMESHGRPHRIQVSATTHALLESRYTFSAPQVVDIKGKGPMTTYFLLGALG